MEEKNKKRKHPRRPSPPPSQGEQEAIIDPAEPVSAPPAPSEPEAERDVERDEPGGPGESEDVEHGRLRDAEERRPHSPH